MVAGLLPSSLTNRLFRGFTNQSFIPSVTGQKQDRDPGYGMWLVCVMFQGNNLEHWSQYVFSQSSAYAKSLTKIHSYDYNNNSSCSVSVRESGYPGITITANYTNIGSSGVTVLFYRLI